MTLKLGMRVTVKPGVSPCKDEGSLQRGRNAEGIDRSHLVGRKGEVVQIGQEVLAVKQCAGQHGEFRIPDHHCASPATIPPGCENCVLVDSHVSNGVRQGDGQAGWREWLREDEVEPG